jgi:hypothetical protein
VIDQVAEGPSYPEAALKSLVDIDYLCPVRRNAANDWDDLLVCHLDTTDFGVHLEDCCKDPANPLLAPNRDSSLVVFCMDLANSVGLVLILAARWLEGGPFPHPEEL